MKNNLSLKYCLFVSLSVMLLMGCTDTLSLAEGQPEMRDGIQFHVTTQEMGDLMIGVGSIRSAQAVSNASRSADAFTSRPMTGDNPYGLNLHRMPLPYVGIHSKAVHSGSSMSSNPDMRASVDDIVKSDGTNFHDSLSIWGYTDQGVVLFNQTLLKQIQNWRSAVLWPYNKTSSSPNLTMRFYAIAPSVENLNFSVVEPETPSYDTAPIFKLTLPESVAAMRDVLYGESEIISVQAGPNGSITDDPEQENIGQDNKRIPLTFSHIMTAIRFAQGSTFPAGVTIKSIKLKNIYTTGVFKPKDEDKYTGTMGEWTINEDNRGKYELTNLSNNISGVNTYIDGQQVMFMIPHELTEEDAELEVVLTAPQRFETDNDGNYQLDENGNRKPDSGSQTRQHTVSCKLTGDIWKKGYTVTYRLTIGELEDGYYLMAESPEPFEHSTQKQKGTFTVHSYRSYYDYSDNPLGEENDSHGVGWEIVGYDDENEDEDGKFEENKPDWLTITTNNDKGGSNTSVDFTLDEAKYSYYYETKFKYKTDNNITKLKHSEVLAANSRAENVNLSENAEKETANCYIVNCEGTYRFSLVYGNKKEDGDEPAGIVDHKGNIISYSKIKDQLEHKYPDKYSWSSDRLRAHIIWQDVEGLASTNTNETNDILPESNLLQFTINKATPGNAVIALQALPKEIEGDKTTANDGDWETLWTWHIWMTDEVNPDGSNAIPLENYDNKETKILPVNLGWKPDKDEFGVYEPREVWVKIQQTESNKKKQATAVICIKQHARQNLITGTSTIYQWGRPTALPMTLYSDGTNTKKRNIYDGDNNLISENFTLQNASELPSGYHIAKTYNMFRWDDTTEGKSVWFDKDVTSVPEYWKVGEKTVYDPCPPGFQVPPVEIFTGLSRTGTSSLYGSQLNIYPDVDGQKSASENDGGYFYIRKFVSEQDMEVNRYYPLVYFPVTGEWKDGGKSRGEYGLYWCADHDSQDKTNASILWIRPEWSYPGMDGPVIQFGRTIPYSSAQPIRPMAR